MEQLYRWVKASERLPSKSGFYFIKSRYGQMSCYYCETDNFNCAWDNKYDDVSWVEQIPESEQGELWDAVIVLAMEDEFREYNGQYCPDGFNVYKFIKKLSSTYNLIKKINNEK